MPDAQDFVPVQKNEWDPVPLTIGRSLKVARIIAWMLFDAALSLPKSREEFNSSHVATLLAALDEDRITALYGAILDKEPEWVASNWNLKAAVSCLIRFWRDEDLGGVFELAGQLSSTRNGSSNSSTDLQESTGGR